MGKLVIKADKSIVEHWPMHLTVDQLVHLDEVFDPCN